MGKIYMYILIVPVFLVLLYRIITLHEYDTKQRYLKDITDAMAQKVKITGVLTEYDLKCFKLRINGIADFNDNAINKAVELKKCNSINNIDDVFVEYLTGEQLSKGDVFRLTIKSSDVSIFSRLHNKGINPNDDKNLYYKAKSECRVEYVP